MPLEQQPVLTPETLLKVARDINWHRISRQFPRDCQPDYLKVLVTFEDISDVADALKSNAFYVPGYCYRAATELAKEQGCLRESENLTEPRF
jgi:hypothetical protein